MNKTKHIEEKLRELPKPSLTEVQKARILNQIQSRSSSRKRHYYRPLLAIFAACTAFFLLVLSEFPEMKTAVQHLFQPEIKLTAPEAEVFTLENRSEYQVLGLKNKVALLFGGEYFVAEDKMRTAKMFISYWGNPESLVSKNYRVVAMNKHSEKMTLSTGTLSSGVYNEDAHALTSFPSFPSEGKWQLSFFVEDRLHGEFTVDVLPPFLKTEHYTVLEHPNELEAGLYTISNIETVLDKKSVQVDLLDRNGEIVSSSTFTQDGKFINAETGENLYHLRGALQLPGTGTWTLIIDGEKTKAFKN